MNDNIITCIDIWSSKIRTLIWSYQEESWALNILWVWIADSLAIRRWNILDMDEFKSNLDKSLEEAEKMSWEHSAWAFISFNSSSFDVIQNKWIIAVSWESISSDDVERVLDMAKSPVSLPNREVLKVVPDYFTLDLEEWVKSPIWMTARKLEVLANIFSVNWSMLNNIKKSISDIWIDVYDIFPNLLSSCESILNKRQKELWVVCVDIWSSTTWVTVYEEWTLKFSWIIPIWWDSITNDIALWLRISIDTAEKLKLEHWELGLSKIDNYKDLEINLHKICETEDWEVSKVYLSKIIDARAEEILYFVKDMLKRIWKHWMLPEWAIFVWSWPKLNWLIDLSKDILRLPCSIWTPACDDLIGQTSLWDPSFAWVVWTMIISNKYRKFKNVIWFSIFSIFGSIIKVFKKLLP